MYFFSFYSSCGDRDSSKLKQEKANAVYIHECDYKLLHFSNANRFCLSLSQTLLLPEFTMSSMADLL